MPAFIEAILVPKTGDIESNLHNHLALLHRTLKKILASGSGIPQEEILLHISRHHSIPDPNSLDIILRIEGFPTAQLVQQAEQVCLTLAEALETLARGALQIEGNGCEVRMIFPQGISCQMKGLMMPQLVSYLNGNYAVIDPISQFE